MRQDITITAQMIYNCPVTDTLRDQGEAIHEDLTRLLISDSTSSAVCRAVTLTELSPEADAYGSDNARKLAERQSDRLMDALASLYGVDDAEDVLSYALCDLRHLADQNGLSFARYDKTAFQVYRAEKDASNTGGAS